jgi:argininosuccinate synthase
MLLRLRAHDLLAELLNLPLHRHAPLSRAPGVRLDPVSLIRRANALAGSHGFGRLDMVENRVVGIKSREIYEAPGLLLLIKAHQELESLTLAADVQRYKRQVEMSWADLVYQGLWFGPLKDALDGFLDRTQATVNGLVRIRLQKGSATVVGRSSASDSLYVPDMATYGAEDLFDHRAAEGFIYVWGLPTRLWSARHRGG